MSTKIIKKTVKTYNRLLLSREIQTMFGENSLSFPGFSPVDDYRVSPNATSVEYGRIKQGGEETVLTADPGELHIVLTVDPGQPLDDLLAAHNAATQTEQEQKRDQAVVDRALVEAALVRRGAFTDDEIHALARLVLK